MTQLDYYTGLFKLVVAMVGSTLAVTLACVLVYTVYYHYRYFR